MKILLTNDDGIRAPGIASLHRVLGGHDSVYKTPLGEALWTVAPETVQSATSHGVTFREPLMVRHVTVNEHLSGIAVDGRPADCSKLAISSLWPDEFGQDTRPDLVVSGMNAGANIGVNVIYSGTVAAALEAAFLGVPSIAVSLHLGRGRPRFDVASRWARAAIERVIEQGLPSPHECININIPRVQEPEESGKTGDPIARYELESGSPEPTADVDETMPPIVVCPMNMHGMVDSYERRQSPSGDVYYWAAGSGFEFAGTDRESDVEYLLKGCITVTPLTHDLTEHGALERWRSRVGS